MLGDLDQQPPIGGSALPHLAVEVKKRIQTKTSYFLYQLVKTRNNSDKQYTMSKRRKHISNGKS